MRRGRGDRRATTLTRRGRAASPRPLPLPYVPSYRYSHFALLTGSLQFLDPPKSSQQLYDQLSSALTRTLNLFLTPGATQILYKTLATSFMTRLESLMLDVKEDVENALAKIHNGEEVVRPSAQMSRRTSS